MNKFIFFIFAILNLVGMFFCASTNNSIKQKKYKTAITLKNGYFFLKDKVLRDIRGGSGGKHWLEGAIRYNPWKKLNLEANISYFKLSGNALHSTTNSNNDLICNDNKFTKVTMPTLGFGLKYFWTHCNLGELFIGTGLRAFFYRERNNSPYLINRVNKTIIGNMINSGIKIAPFKKSTFLKKLFITIFVDYNWAKIKPDYCLCGYPNYEDITPSNKRNIHLGGYIVGIGIGYKI